MTDMMRPEGDGKWHIAGRDTFSNEDYPLDGAWDTEGDAVDAANARLKHLEETQPTASSGGQSTVGIQDRVYVIRPDGSRYRVGGVSLLVLASKVKQFGPTRHTRDLEWTVTPVGLPCVLGCGREIGDNDEGFVLSDETVAHRPCLLENILGPSWRTVTGDPA